MVFIMINFVKHPIQTCEEGRPASRTCVRQRLVGLEKLRTYSLHIFHLGIWTWFIDQTFQLWYLDYILRKIFRCKSVFCFLTSLASVRELVHRQWAPPLPFGSWGEALCLAGLHWRYKIHTWRETRERPPWAWKLDDRIFRLCPAANCKCKS